MGRKPQGRDYNPEIRKTEVGSRLYTAWKKVRSGPHCDEWDDFVGFYEWASNSNYVLGAKLCLIDDSGMYCPKNVVWLLPDMEAEGATSDEEFVYEWNQTVNRIRKHYGMPPLRGTNYADF